jgi:hypothetical protein
MTEPPRSAEGRAVAAALAEVARLGRRLDEFEAKLAASTSEVAQIAEIRSGLAELSGLVRELLEREEVETRGERAPWWPDLRPSEERTAALRLLGAWVDEVIRGRHSEAYRDSLQPCWYRHPDVLDELTALRAAWYAAYRDKAASSSAAIEWHDRWLPGCMARCKAAMKALACDKNGHQEPRKPAPFYDSVEFKDFTEAD